MDLPEAGIKPVFPAWQVDLLSHLGSPSYITYCSVNYRASLVALVVKNLPANAQDLRDAGSVPGLGRSPGEGNGNPLQYSCLENLMDRGAWRVIVHGVTESQTQLM